MWGTCHGFFMTNNFHIETFSYSTKMIMHIAWLTTFSTVFIYLFFLFILPSWIKLTRRIMEIQHWKGHLINKISNNHDGQISRKRKKRNEKFIKFVTLVHKNPISSKFQKRKVLIDVSGSRMRMRNNWKAAAKFLFLAPLLREIN